MILIIISLIIIIITTIINKHINRGSYSRTWGYPK